MTIVAVTKTYGPDAPQAAWEAGLRDVGENKVQEALGEDGRMVDAPLRWHLIGHLQRNKVKQIDPLPSRPLDGQRAARGCAASHGVARGRPVEVLVQVNVSGEETKGGYQPSMIAQEAGRLRWTAGTRRARRDDDGAVRCGRGDAARGVRRRARGARSCCARAGHPATELSMGMSGDYEVAVEEGATMVRLGTVLFGARAA